MRLKMAILKFIDGYFATCERSLKTFSAYKCDLGQFQLHVSRNLALRSITPEMIEDWMKTLKTLEYSPNSIRRKVASLKCFFNYWVRRRVLKLSPCVYLRLVPSNHTNLPCTLSVEEMKLLVEAAEERVIYVQNVAPLKSTRVFLALRNQAIINLMYATGLRVGEVESLSICDVSVQEGVLRVSGKGRRQRIALIVDDGSKELLSKYIAARMKIETKSDAVFVNLFRTRLTVQGIANAIARIAELAGIERHITPHMLRHTAATLLLKNGADIRVIQEFLGHSSILTTQRYTQVSKQVLTETLQSYHPLACQ